MKDKIILIAFIFLIAGIWAYTMGPYDIYDKVAMLEGYVDEDYLQAVQATMISGLQWRELTRKEKSLYLFGLGDGVLNTTAYFVPMDDRKRESENRLAEYYSDMSRDELIDKIDRFYENSKHLTVPVPHALLVIRNNELHLQDPDSEKLTAYYQNEIDRILANHSSSQIQE